MDMIMEQKILRIVTNRSRERKETTIQTLSRLSGVEEERLKRMILKLEKENELRIANGFIYNGKKPS
ncbi:hypothetical protein [Alkalihalobacillus trypoxylicola]|uniref:Uncharacterized protein n=1 Tax=Alkalihalobacillus trypoxylicola TaxID=519424 RepID=A0A161PAE5_9BACI|nr:hypothetical protein [Alkalihalobacillus trypoxylicola]KYG28191.1 hypothetical protein AZF04_09825 [Alkalihalobacillus trypoxylicola]